VDGCGIDRERALGRDDLPEPAVEGWTGETELGDGGNERVRVIDVTDEHVAEARLLSWTTGDSAARSVR
jgi:hypothetical protein